VTLRYRVGVAASLPTGVAAEIERRFGPVRATTVRDRGVVLDGDLMDQSALRGLLTLLWDVNAELVSLDVSGPRVDG
jgi:hypothetical protein